VLEPATRTMTGPSVAEHDPEGPLIAHVVLAVVLRVAPGTGTVRHDGVVASRPATALSFGDDGSRHHFGKSVLRR